MGAIQRRSHATKPFRMIIRGDSSPFVISTAKLHLKKYLSVISHTIQKFGHRFRGVNTSIALKQSYIYIYLFIYIYKEGSIYICAYFLACNFAGFYAPLYALVSVSTILDRYHGHFCPIVNAHAGYRVSQLLDSVRNNG
jgi:hypothetical protein